METIINQDYQQLQLNDTSISNEMFTRADTVCTPHLQQLNEQVNEDEMEMNQNSSLEQQVHSCMTRRLQFQQNKALTQNQLLTTQSPSRIKLQQKLIFVKIPPTDIEQNPSDSQDDQQSESSMSVEDLQHQQMEQMDDNQSQNQLNIELNTHQNMRTITEIESIPQQQQHVIDNESTISYIKSNMIMAIAILLITIVSYNNTCQAPLHLWLLVEVFLMSTDSLLKCISLKMKFQNMQSFGFWIVETVFECVQAGWMIYGNYIFVQQSQNCIESAPILTYTFLFVLIVGFIVLAKFAVLVLAIIIWLIAKLFKYDISFRQIFFDRTYQEDMMTDGYIRSIDGAKQEDIDALEQRNFRSFKTQGIYEDNYKDEESVNYTCNIKQEMIEKRYSKTSIKSVKDKKGSELVSMTPRAKKSKNQIEVFVMRDSCAICCEKFKNKDEISVLPCHRLHIYHKACIKSWLTLNNSCPLCKKPISR